MNLKAYRRIIRIAKVPPIRRAGSTIILIISYSSLRKMGSILLTVTNAAVIGKMTITRPQNKLLKNPESDAVIIQKFLYQIFKD